MVTNKDAIRGAATAPNEDNKPRKSIQRDTENGKDKPSSQSASIFDPLNPLGVFAMRLLAQDKSDSNTLNKNRTDAFDEDPKDPIDRAYRQFHDEFDAKQDETTSKPTPEKEQRPSHPSSGKTGHAVQQNQSQERSTAHERPSPTTSRVTEAWKNTTGKENKLKLDAADKQDTRLHLMESIDAVAGTYAKEAGVSAGFLARMLDGKAVIESRYGVLRSVTGTKHYSSAGGAFHFLDAHTRTMVAKYGHRPEIRAQLLDLGIDPNKKKLSESDCWKIKDDDHLAASFVALEDIEVLKSNPHLRGNVNDAIAHSYMRHNIGAVGQKTLMTDGVAALQKVDYRITENNPMFFRGVNSRDEVMNRYTKYTSNAINAAADLRNKVHRPADKAPTTTLAKTELVPGLNIS